MDCSFLFWKYKFLDDCILIHRNLWFEKTNQIYTNKIEMVSSFSSPIMRLFKRQNLALTFAGNIFTLFGVPNKAADWFCARFEGEENVDGEMKITLNSRDILKMSFFQSHIVWYFTILGLIWASVIVLSIPQLSVDTAKLVTDFIFRHMLVAGTLVLSIGLPYIIIWLWAITGGFLKEYLKYYKYTAIRRKSTLSYEYGMIFHRKIVISSERIAVALYQQTPSMRAFGYGKLYIRAVGYNPYFLKKQPILPFLKYRKLHEFLERLVPEMNMERQPRQKRRFYYYLFSWRWIIPLLFLPPAIFHETTWLIPMSVALFLVLVSIFLEYANSYFESDRTLTILSKGGFNRTIACVFTERIELIAKSGSRAKLRRGFANVKIHVFGKSGTFAKVRNVEIQKLDPFKIPDSSYFRSGKGK